MKFHLEKFKLECDVLRQHMTSCSKRLDDLTKQRQREESFNEVDLSVEIFSTLRAFFCFVFFSLEKSL